MCVIVIGRAKELDNVKAEDLKAMYEHNGDGCGLAFGRRNRIQIVKGIWSFDKFLKLLDMAKHVADGHIMIHMRIATHGDKQSVQNCHPFRISKDIAMCHNGTLSCYPKFLDQSKSDTYWFAHTLRTFIGQNSLLQRLRADNNFSKGLEEWHGKGNRFAFLFNGGLVKTGQWYGLGQTGVTISNFNWQKPKAKVINTNVQNGPNLNLEFSSLSRKERKRLKKLLKEEGLSYQKFWEKVNLEDRLNNCHC